MKLNEITKPVTAESLNQSLANNFGTKINISKFTNEQLDDARNKLRTQLASIETKESYDNVHKSTAYQKSKLFLDVINATIAERSDNINEFNKEDEKEADKDSKKMQKKGSQATSSPSQGGKKTDEGISATDKKTGKKIVPGTPEWNAKYNKGMKKKTNEGAKPDFADIDGDGDEKEPMTKAAQDKKEKEGSKDDSKGLSDKQKKLPKGLQKAIAKKKTNEGKEDEAEIVMAAKDMVDRVTSWMEDTAEMQTESMLELADAIRDELGIQQSDAFVQTVKPALESMYGAMETTRGSLTQGVGMLTGEGEMEPTMGDEPEAPAPEADAEMEPTVDQDDEFAAAEAGAGGEEEAGRAKRESVEMSRRLGHILTGASKKKS